eukprot:gene19847-26542_t
MASASVGLESVAAESVGAFAPSFASALPAPLMSEDARAAGDGVDLRDLLRGYEERSEVKERRNPGEVRAVKFAVKGGNTEVVRSTVSTMIAHADHVDSRGGPEEKGSRGQDRRLNRQSDRRDQPEKPDQLGRPDGRPNRQSDRRDQPEKADQLDRPDGRFTRLSERRDQPDKPDQLDRPDGSDRGREAERRDGRRHYSGHDDRRAEDTVDASSGRDNNYGAPSSRVTSSNGPGGGRGGRQDGKDGLERHQPRPQARRNPGIPDEQREEGEERGRRQGRRDSGPDRNRQRLETGEEGEERGQKQGRRDSGPDHNRQRLETGEEGEERGQRQGRRDSGPDHNRQRLETGEEGEERGQKQGRRDSGPDQNRQRLEVGEERGQRQGRRDSGPDQNRQRLEEGEDRGQRTGLREPGPDQNRQHWDGGGFGRGGRGRADRMDGHDDRVAHGSQRGGFRGGMRDSFQHDDRGGVGGQRDRDRGNNGRSDRYSPYARPADRHPRGNARRAASPGPKWSHDMFEHDDGDGATKVEDTITGSPYPETADEPPQWGQPNPLFSP